MSSNAQIETGDTSGMFGHPLGLGTLFFTELWERFSYYGMRAILVLYMVAPVTAGGLGFDVKTAASIYGTYTMSVYLTALPGGMIADRWLGTRLAVLLGGIVIACGHFSMVFHNIAFFYLGMVLIAVGTGLLKPNISAMIGNLYSKDDPRRDSGFSIFYMGINIGASSRRLFAAISRRAKASNAFVASMGFDVSTSWHWAFGAAGVGMCIGLIVFLMKHKRLPIHHRAVSDKASDEERADESVSAAAASAVADSRPRNPIIAVILSLILPGMGHIYKGQVGAGLSWLSGLRAGSDLVFCGRGNDPWVYHHWIGDRLRDLGCARNNSHHPVVCGRVETRRRNFRLLPVHDSFLGGIRAEGRELESLRERFGAHRIFRHEVSFELLAILHAAVRHHAGPILFHALGKTRQASTIKPGEVYFRFALHRPRLLPACSRCLDDCYGRISPLWLVGLYFLEVLGEMCLSPVGLSTVTKLAPVKLVGIMMGVWFLAASFGSKLAGLPFGLLCSAVGPTG